MHNYIATVKFTYINDDGKEKKKVRRYLIENAVTVGDAEIRILEFLKNATESYEVKSVVQSNIEEVIKN
ncbi:hypothetical protein [Microcystis phage Mel-JY01]